MELGSEEKSYIREHAGEGYELLKELAQIPAPSNHEERRTEFCKNWLEKNGAKGVYVDSAGNVVYPHHVTATNPVIVFMAHMDVVFPDETLLPWKEEGGRLCCPGVGDDTANLVALLLSARYVAERDLKPSDGCGVLFVCNTGEEGLGNLRGSRKICEDYGNRIKAFTSFDCTMDTIACRAVGSERFRVNVKTEGGHSYSCFGNPNAIAVMADLIREIYEISVPEGGKTTYNVGVIEGGTSVNTIAQEVHMLCEYRSDDADSLDWMKARFAEIFSKKREGAVVSVEVVGLRPCERLNEEQKKVREEMLDFAKETLACITGKMPALVPISTDCNIPLSMGIPSVCYGTCFGAGAHTREEYVERDSIGLGYEVALSGVLRYFSK